MIVAALCLLALLTPAFSGESWGTKIGDLPTHYHEVRGELYVEDEYTFSIRNFSYDGLGPDAFLYFYYPGDTNPFDSTGGGVIINITTQASGRPQFDVNVRIRDEPFYRFTLPMNRFRACDFAGFSIWCRYANQLFTTLAWNYTDVFSANGSNSTVACTPSPGRGYAGSLPNNGGGVGGELYFVDNKNIAIRNFTYSSSETGVYVYWFPPGTEPSNDGGNKIMLNTSNSAFDPAITYDGSSVFTITLPDGAYTCDIGTFTLWCTSCSPQTFFTTLPINLELFSNSRYEVAYEPNRLLCNRTTTRPGLYINELPTSDPRLISGSFYVVDQYTFFIQLFSFDTTEYEDVYLYYFPTGVAVTDSGAGGGTINLTATMGKFGTGKGDSFYNQDLTVDLRLSNPRVRACDIGYFALRSNKPNNNEIITRMRIPQAVFYASSDEGRLGAVQCDVTGGTPRLVMTYSLAAILVVLAYAFAL